MWQPPTPLPNCLTALLQRALSLRPGHSNTGMPLYSAVLIEWPLFHCDNIRHQGLHSHRAPRHTFMTWVSGTDICSHRLNAPSSHTYTDTQTLSVSQTTHKYADTCVCARTLSLYLALTFYWISHHLLLRSQTHRHSWASCSVRRL